MIKIKDIKKEENNNYFITYIKDGEVLTYSGNAKEIVKEVTKNFKKGNKND